MKLKIILIVALLLIAAKTMVVKTHSTYTITSDYTISIVPERGNAHQQTASSAQSDTSANMS